MEMTQHDLDARVQRAAAGVATDDDLRLIKLYEREGWKSGARDGEFRGDGDKVEAPDSGADNEPDNSPDNDDAEPDDGSTARGRGRGRGAGRARAAK